MVSYFLLIFCLTLTLMGGGGGGGTGFLHGRRSCVLAGWLAIRSSATPLLFALS